MKLVINLCVSKAVVSKKFGERKNIVFVFVPEMGQGLLTVRSLCSALLSPSGSREAKPNHLLHILPCCNLHLASGCSCTDSSQVSQGHIHQSMFK